MGNPALKRSEAMETQPEAISIELSLDLLSLDGRVKAAAELWQAWADEEDRDADCEAFARHMLNRALDGSGTVLVAFTEMGRAVGMISLGWDYDPAKSRRRCIAERLYVVEDYRDRSVWRALADGARAYAWLVAADEYVVSCRADSHLRRRYEQEGFRVTDYILKKSVNDV